MSRRHRRRGQGGRYDDAAWKHIRLQILARDGYTCQIQGAHCTTTATEVDHKIPLELGGARLDPNNLRAACRACNAGRSSRLRREAWRTQGGVAAETGMGGGTRIHLVIGPPAGGKTAWLADRVGPHDLVVDLDALLEAVGGAAWGPQDGRWLAAMRGRGAIIEALRRGEIDAPAAWIISTNPEAEQLYPHHDLHVIDPGEATTLQRIRSDPNRPTGQLDAARRWYAARPGGTQPSSGNTPPGRGSSRNW